MGVGRRLREARDAKGLTLAALSERTKIPGRQLTLLEGEQYDRLPAGIFGRGYVRAVALALGLDADRLVEEYRRELQPAPPPPPARGLHASLDPPPESLRLQLAGDEPSPAGEGRSNGRMLAFVLIAVSLILMMLWLRRDGSPAPDAGAQGPGGGVGAVSEDAAPASGEAVGAIGIMGTLPAGAAIAGETPLVVSVEAQGPCWLALQADGRRVAYRLLQPGDAVTAEARREVILRTGNAGALQLTINGTRAQRIGSGGAVQTIHITPGNYRALLGGQGE